ncbi:uncharacterized protein N7487_002040 [Penicillium crustosum]|uniref:uncharacterized protein n=1 Tax=Penicillium crustosum TaxID=36656 RepID=UPI0023929AEB|nr:uncharacterized protein N7487_002040 [Penicillium crustosum]KAJ5418490.1 hypothetical protein N7487_002040 [Penicillium crustosum]
MISESPRSSREDDSFQRRKRAKYTQVACNECKRRKLKCSGGLVCVRCSRDQVPCVYATNRPSVSTLETDPKDERWGSEVF